MSNPADLSGFFRKNALLGGIEIFGRIPMIFAAGVLAGAVGPDLFGTWALVLLFQGVLASITGLGLSSSLSRLASVSSDGEARSYLLTGLIAAAAAVLGGAVLTIFLRSWFGAALGVPVDLRWLLLPGVLIAANTVSESLLDAYFKAREAIGRQAGLVLGRSIIELTAVSLVFATTLTAGFDPARQILTYALLTAALRLLYYPWLVLRRAPSRAPVSRGERTTFLRYGIPIIPTAILALFAGQGDRLILSHFVSAGDLGIYAFGALLAGNMAYLGYAVYPLLLPRASRLYESQQFDNLARLFDSSQYVFLFLFAAATTTIILLGREIILITAGESFTTGFVTLIVLSFAIGLDQMLGIYNWIFHLTRRTSLILLLSLAHAALLLGSIVAAAWIGGAALAPWGILAAVVAANALRYTVAQGQHRLPMPTVVLVGLLVLAGIVVPIAWLLNESDLFVRLPLSVAVTILCLFAVLRITRGTLSAAEAS